MVSLPGSLLELTTELRPSDSQSRAMTFGWATSEETMRAGFDSFYSKTSKGVCFPRDHMTLDPDTDDEFWQFSQDEMSKYDLPSQLNYVLQSTKKEKVFDLMDMNSIILCRFSMSAIQWAPQPTWR